MLNRLVKDLIEEFMEDWDDVETQNKLKERFFDPMIHYLIDKIYPYLIVSLTVVFLLISLLVIILFIILKK